MRYPSDSVLIDVRSLPPTLLAHLSTQPVSGQTTSLHRTSSVSLSAPLSLACSSLAVVALRASATGCYQSSYQGQSQLSESCRSIQQSTKGVCQFRFQHLRSISFTFRYCFVFLFSPSKAENPPCFAAPAAFVAAVDLLMVLSSHCSWSLPKIAERLSPCRQLHPFFEVVSLHVFNTEAQSSSDCDFPLAVRHPLLGRSGPRGSHALTTGSKERSFFSRVQSRPEPVFSDDLVSLQGATDGDGTTVSLRGSLSLSLVSRGHLYATFGTCHSKQRRRTTISPPWSCVVADVSSREKKKTSLHSCY